jgi:hypothetical protein
MTSIDTSGVPLTGGDIAAEWLRNWQRMWGLAPDTLVQPILPGWSFNINNTNSSSPQTELDVVTKYSYGRQIGRMADALATLVVQLHGSKPPDQNLAEFLQMKEAIDQVKHDSAAARIERFKADLELLKAKDQAEYERLRGALRAALGD